MKPLTLNELKAKLVEKGWMFEFLDMSSTTRMLEDVVEIVNEREDDRQD